MIVGGISMSIVLGLSRRDSGTACIHYGPVIPLSYNFQVVTRFTPLPFQLRGNPFHARNDLFPGKTGAPCVNRTYNLRKLKVETRWLQLAQL